MAVFRNKYRVESARLATWDYSTPWWYYITVVVKERRCDLGEAVEDRVVLSALGKVVEECWKAIPEHHPGVELDDYVIMPNHMHGIVILNGVAENRANAQRDVQLNVSTANAEIEPSPGMKSEFFRHISPPTGSLSVVLRTFKAAVTTWARANGHAGFSWQARFHDHLIRNENDLQRIREYIANNPLRWALDEENPGLKNASPDRKD